MQPKNVLYEYDCLNLKYFSTFQAVLARALNKGQRGSQFCVITCKTEQGHFVACFLIAKAGFSHQLS